MEKYYTAGQAIDDSKAHAHCMLDTYKQALTIILIAFPLIRNIILVDNGTAENYSGMHRTRIQGVTGGMCETSGYCSLGQIIPI